MSLHPLLTTAGVPQAATSVTPSAVASPAVRAIARAVVAYAAGDAFGVAYEYAPEAQPVVIDRISARDGWPFGGVSDDTLLSLLTIEAVIPGRPQESAQEFLAALHREAPRLRGLGPTTRAALGMPVKPDEEHWVGNSNGGMMRTALVGLAYRAGAGVERRAMTAALAAATHRDPAAVICAVLAARLFSDALDGSTTTAHEALAEEAHLLGAEMPAAPSIADSVVTWTPAPDGVSLMPADTLGAVVHIASHAPTCLEAYREACELGGDTDTVSALAAALVAAREPETCGVTDIAWLLDVQWGEIPQADAAVARLAELREGTGEY